MDTRNPDVKFLAHFRESDGAEQGLWEHLRNVACLASEFADKVGLREIGQILGLLHDLGKGTREFDTYIRTAVGLIDGTNEVSEGKLDHSTAGAQYILSFLKDGIGPLSAQIMALIIASHHSGLIDCLNPDGVDLFSKRLQKDKSETRVEQTAANLEPSIRDEISKLAALNLDSKLREFFQNGHDPLDSREEICYKLGLLTRLLFSCLIDADRIDTADFENKDTKQLRQRSQYPDWSILIGRLEARLSEFKVRSSMDLMRREISEKCRNIAVGDKGLYRLTVPTGGGKTLASLRFGLHHAHEHRMDRIIYVIPYTSIIDQNANEIRTIMEVNEEEKGRVVLEHHSSLTPEKETQLNKILSENWDAPIVLTTMVQFLEALFGGGTRSSRRMHQLINSVIIFDEIQSMPIQCIHLFNVAIRFLIYNCKSTVMLCTATQPLLHQVTPRTRALPYDPHKVVSIDTTSVKDALSRADIIDLTTQDPLSFSQAAVLASEQLNLSDSVLMIVNTKKAAYEIFNHLPNDPNVQKYHLSTNMCPAHRLEVIQRVRNALKEKKPVICISTQLIEAGVDVDFGVVIRSLAGLDSVAQAAGRCNRHNIRAEGGRLLLVQLKDENVDRLVEIKEGQRIALRVLSEYRRDPGQFGGSIISSPALERYFEYYFFQRRGLMSYPVGKHSGVGRKDSIYNLLAANKISVDEYKSLHKESPKIYLRQAFASASKAFKVIENSAQGVIVPYGVRGQELIQNLCGAFDLEKQYQLLRAAQRYSVNCFPHLLQELLEKRAIHEVQKGSGIFYLDKRYYDDNFGLHIGTVSLMDTLTV